LAIVGGRLDSRLEKLNNLVIGQRAGLPFDDLFHPVAHRETAIEELRKGDDPPIGERDGFVGHGPGNR
jgi:hypothetical protein